MRNVQLFCSYYKSTVGRTDGVLSTGTQRRLRIGPQTVQYLLSAYVGNSSPTTHKQLLATSANDSTALLAHRGADKSLARPGRKQATATKNFDVHISYL